MTLCQKRKSRKELTLEDPEGLTLEDPKELVLVDPKKLTLEDPKELILVDLEKLNYKNQNLQSRVRKCD